ncbi:MAG: polysulfide reductase NrfD [Desulfobulbaceae bacterium]|nr:polysulfide reductase NrfD [Desulfobulbaceae bacterium]
MQKEYVADFFAQLRHFLSQAAQRLIKGPPIYYGWLSFLLLIVGAGVYAYTYQFEQGLNITGMTDQVSWGLYISNFTFLVGVAAAAVLLIIPAYVYNFGPIKEITILGEILAVCAILMCMMFVTLDLGRPERMWHLMPIIGRPNFPSSILDWDVLVLNGYLYLNLFVSIYLLSTMYFKRKVNYRLILPFIFLSIPWAVSIHTVTAYLYNGLGARPFWNSAILAPRFLASAFCSGPALCIIIFQVVRKFTNFNVSDKAIFKIGEMICIAMGINLLLLGAEVFKELYTDSVHKAPIVYLFVGLHGHDSLVKWIWTAMAFNITSFFLFLIPKTRKKYITLNIACVLIVVGVWIEKGMGLVIPGFIPSPLGEIWEYSPRLYESMITVGVWALGMILYTLALKIAIPIELGEMHMLEKETPLPDDEAINVEYFN